MLPPLTAGAAETWTLLRPAARVTFTVLMPAPAEKQGDKSEWRCQDRSGNLYTAAMGYYAEPKITDADGFIRKFVAQLASQTQCRVAYTWFYKQQRAPACEFKLVKEGDPRLTVIRYVLVGQYFYLLSYVATSESLDMKAMKKFFDSFRMFNPELGNL